MSLSINPQNSAAAINLTQATSDSNSKEKEASSIVQIAQQALNAISLHVPTVKPNLLPQINQLLQKLASLFKPYNITIDELKLLNLHQIVNLGMITLLTTVIDKKPLPKKLDDLTECFTNLSEGITEGNWRILGIPKPIPKETEDLLLEKAQNYAKIAAASVTGEISVKQVTTSQLPLSKLFVPFLKLMESSDEKQLGLRSILATLEILKNLANQSDQQLSFTQVENADKAKSLRTLLNFTSERFKELSIFSLLLIKSTQHSLIKQLKVFQSSTPSLKYRRNTSNSPLLDAKKMFRAAEKHLVPILRCLESPNASAKTVHKFELAIHAIDPSKASSILTIISIGNQVWNRWHTHATPFHNKLEAGDYTAQMTNMGTDIINESLSKLDNTNPLLNNLCSTIAGLSKSLEALAPILMTRVQPNKKHIFEQFLQPILKDVHQITTALNLISKLGLITLEVCQNGVQQASGTTEAPSWLQRIDEFDECETAQQESLVVIPVTAKSKKKKTHKKSQTAAADSTTDNETEKEDSAAAPPKQFSLVTVPYNSESMRLLSLFRSVKSQAINEDSTAMIHEIASKTQTASEIASHQASLSTDAYLWILEMLDKTQNVEQRSLLTTFAHLWGYLAVEQEHTASFLTRFSIEEIDHNIDAQRSALKLNTHSLWAQQPNISLAVRYPFSCLEYNLQSEQQRSLVLKHATATLPQECTTLTKLATESFAKEMTYDIVKVNREAMLFRLSHAQKLSTPNLEAFKKKSLEAPSTSQNDLKAVTLSDSHLKILTGIQAKLESVVKSTEGQHFNSAAFNNMRTHLQRLYNLIGLFITNSEHRFLFIHAHICAFSTQYLAENLGTFLPKENQYIARTHNLEIYQWVHGLGKSFLIDKSHAHLAKTFTALNNKKWIEYPFGYFKHVPANEWSPTMLFLSGLFSTAHTKKAIAENELKRLHEELITHIDQHANLAIKLIESHIG